MSQSGAASKESLLFVQLIGSLPDEWCVSEAGRPSVVLLQRNCLDYYVEMGYVDQKTILVGHSCGSVFLARYLFERPELEVSCLVTVSGYNGFISGNERMDALNKDFYTESSLGEIKRKVGQIHSFYSKNDPFIPVSYLEEFARGLGGQEHVIENAGHFNSDAGLDAFPELLDLIGSIS